MASWKKEVSTLELFLFIFTMCFAPQYLAIDIRPAFYIFWIFVIYTRISSSRKIILTNYSKITLVFLLILSIYSLTVVLFSLSGDHYVYMRYVRALIALIIIVLYVNNSNVNFRKLIYALLAILTLHSVIIIAEIINPEVKNLLIPFSGESRIFYPYRANGIVNAYDLAGLYTVLGLLISSILYLQSHKNIFLVISFLCIVATLFTSRLNIIVLVLALVFIYIKAKGKNTMVFKTIILFLIMASSLIGLSLLSITTDIFPGIRNIIFTNEWSNNLYAEVRNTYSDDNVQAKILQHFSVGIDSAKDLLFGKGTEGDTDPGYSKIINSIGLIGMISITLYYFIQLFYIKKIKPKSLLDDEYSIYIPIAFILLIMVFGNLKILYFFSTSLFELLSLLLIVYEFNYFKKKIKIISKYCIESRKNIEEES